MASDQQMHIHDLIPCARFNGSGRNDAPSQQEQYLAPVFAWDGKNALVSWTPELLAMTGQSENVMREGLVKATELPGFAGYFYWSPTQQQIIDLNQGTSYAMNRSPTLTTAGSAQPVGAGRGTSP